MTGPGITGSSAFGEAVSAELKGALISGRNFSSGCRCYRANPSKLGRQCKLVKRVRGPDF